MYKFTNSISRKDFLAGIAFWGFEPAATLPDEGDYT